MRELHRLRLRWASSAVEGEARKAIYGVRAGNGKKLIFKTRFSELSSTNAQSIGRVKRWPNVKGSASRIHAANAR